LQPFFASLFKEDYPQDNGWSVYSAKREYERLGVPVEGWRYTKANSKYELCDTYPQLVSSPTLTWQNKRYFSATLLKFQF